MQSVSELIRWVGQQGLDLIVLPGVGILAIWVARTGFGKRALINAPVRRNCLTYQPMLAVLSWLLPPLLIMRVLERLMTGLGPLQAELATNLVVTGCQIPVIGICLLIGKRCFARGLKGMGLCVKGIGKDILWVLVNFLAILSGFLTMVQATVWAGRWLHGPSYQIPRHKELQLLMDYPEWSLRLSIIVLAVFIAPVVEELLFRGLLQSAIRSFVKRPWSGIILVSLVFATIHQNAEHWPALFVLGVGLGYAYERSGSLLRPILIHAMFNGLTILSQLAGP